MPVVSRNNKTVERVDGAKCEYSRSSQILFRNLLDYIDEKDHSQVFFATHNNEFKLRGFYFDFRYKNKLVEYCGNYYHGDPRIYSPTSKIMSRTAKEIWEKDREKDHIADEEGFKLLRVWEDSYSKEPLLVLEKCVNFILSDMTCE